ncbi:hypothetical protein PJ900_01175 (plasmid) [Tistrella mobilis]|uniref:hypothetical protein n=1 Tax=Tistrella mobilis TaxID=171437 RepID=UPI0012E8D9E0|nr:hypothetical protein [Tistrella mobilis]
MKSYISSISHHHSVDGHGHEDGARPGWSRPVLRPLAIAMDTLADNNGSTGFDGMGCPS